MTFLRSTTRRFVLATGLLESLLSFAAVAAVLRAFGFDWAVALTGAAIVVPVSAQMRPPCISMILRTSVRPKPMTLAPAARSIQCMVRCTAPTRCEAQPASQA